MKQVLRPLVRAVMAVGVATSLAAEDGAAPAAIDPEALAIIENASTFLADQQSLSVSWFVSYDSVIDGREKITRTRNGFNLLTRGEGFYSYPEQGLETREFFFDGASFTIHDLELDAFAQIPFAGDFEQLVDRAASEYDITLPIWSILSRQYDDEYVSNATSMAYLGMTRIAGQPAHHIALANYDADWQVWIADDADSPRLLMLVGTNPYEQGWPQYRAYFNEWDFAPEVTEGAFTYVPGENSDRMAWPKVAETIESGE